jgi:FkbM family methyltransferase
MVLPFFIKDSLDFDVLLDSMLKDQYFLIDLEKDEVRSSVKVIFDLGTNIGTAAIKFYQKFPKAIIYCFEPDPYNFERLQKNISLLAQPERIKIYNFAVSDSDNEKVSFYRGSSNHWSSSLIKRGSTGEEVIVETITLDTFCSKNNIEKIDILKMDIEGAESDALDGFKNNLTIVDYFIGEMHPVEMRDSVSSFVARFNSFAIKYLNTDTGVFKFKNLKINN